MVWKTKPFFVNQPSDREKLTCMCIICLNIRLLFDSLLYYAGRYGLEVFTSFSEYFLYLCTCEKGVNGYYMLQCVEGKCNNCKIEPFSYIFQENMSVKFHQLV